MKALKIIKYTFLCVGTLLLAISIIGFFNTRGFLETAIITEGTVTGFSTPYGETSNTNISNSNTYRPFIEFHTKDKQSFTFKPSSSNSSEHYRIGEIVPVLYDKNDPKHAKINNFSHLWTGVLIIGGLGVPFFLIGFILHFLGVSKTRKMARLKERGIQITTEFHKVEQNSFIEVNGQNPYQILCKWKNPKNSKLHIFKSENIWDDPAEFIPENINVFIERDNPGVYYVDLSFLPAT